MLLQNSSSPVNFATNSAAIDNTNLFKSCVKTIRAKRKAAGLEVPASRIFPVSNGVFQNLPVKVSSQFFQKTRDIQHGIDRHRKLLQDHMRRYLGQMNDPSSLSPEECTHMEQIITQNLQAIEQKLSEQENSVPNRAMHYTKKKALIDIRLDHPDILTQNDLAKIGINVAVGHIENCMGLMIVLVRANLQGVNAYFAELKEKRQKKQMIKARLMRFHRPASVKKASELKKNAENSVSSNGSSSHNGSSSNHDDQDNTSLHEDNGKSCVEEISSESWSDEKSSVLSDGKKKDSNCQNKAPPKVTKVNKYEAMLEDMLGPEEFQKLEQENAMMYNELQSTQEEVKNITKQVVELGKLQSVLMENVEEQAIVADNILDTVLHATDDVQEGNEQIREAMRKDASFRVGIMIFLIVMSCTILFLDWYND